MLTARAMKRTAGTNESMSSPMSLVVSLTMCLVLMLSSMASLGAEPGPSADELMQRGASAAQQGALEEALVAWKEAARLYKEAGNIPGQIQALTKAAHAARAMGHVNQAFQQQELALHLAQQIHDPKWIALTLAELGKTYVANHQYDTALQYLTQATEIAKTHDIRRFSAALQNDLGIVRASQGQLREAMTAFQESARLAQEEDLPVLAPRTRINLARVAIQLKQFDEAARYSDEAGRLIPGLAPSSDKADGFINLALVYHDLAVARSPANERYMKLSASSFRRGRCNFRTTRR